MKWKNKPNQNKIKEEKKPQPTLIILYIKYVKGNTMGLDILKMF